MKYAKMTPYRNLQSSKGKKRQDKTEFSEYYRKSGGNVMEVLGEKDHIPFGEWGALVEMVTSGNQKLNRPANKR
jgi:hypothetical protein